MELSGFILGRVYPFDLVSVQLGYSAVGYRGCGPDLRVGVADGEMGDRRVDLVGVGRIRDASLPDTAKKISMAWSAIPRARHRCCPTSERARPPRRGPTPCAVSSPTRTESCAGADEMIVGDKQLAVLLRSGCLPCQTNRVPASSATKDSFRVQGHSDLRVVALVVEDGEISMGRMDASGGECPDTLIIQPPSTCRAVPDIRRLVPPGERSIAHPRRFVYRRDDVLGKGCAPLVATGGGPDHPAGCSATRSSRGRCQATREW